MIQKKKFNLTSGMGHGHNENKHWPVKKQQKKKTTNKTNNLTQQLWQAVQRSH